MNSTPIALLALLVGAAACAPSSPPAAATGAPASAAATSATTAGPAPAASAPGASPAAETRPALQRPLDLANECTHAVHLYYGEHPGDGKGEAAAVATGATVPVPRGPDGAVVVWVTDDGGNGLASVHVTRRMRHVRIDPECMKIDAD